MPCAAFADSGDGDTSGNGLNKNIPLTLIGSLPQHETTGVLLDATIELYFNKNICNVAVLENNETCFHLTSEDGEVIPLTITVPDDQVQQTYKRDAFLKPKENLKPNTTYRVAVDSTLMAKNGTYIDNAHVLTFTTGTETGADEPDKLAKLGSMGIQTFDSALPENENSIPDPQDEETSVYGDYEVSDVASTSGFFSFNSVVLILASVCTILGILIICTLFNIRRKNFR